MRATGIVFLISLLVPAWSWAQVFKCQDAQGRTVYSDLGCASSQSGRLIQRERTFEEKWIEREEARNAQLAKEERRQAKQEREQQEREYWAQEHARQSQAAQQRVITARSKREREDLMRSATTVMPGAHGLTRKQREAALELAETPQERAALMREATTVMRGAPGLTASQLDAASRLHRTRPSQPVPASSYGARQHEDSLPPPQQPEAIDPAATGPASITGCANGWCNDTNGTPYSQSADGRFMHNSATGQTCSVAANGRSMVCH